MPVATVAPSRRRRAAGLLLAVCTAGAAGAAGSAGPASAYAEPGSAPVSHPGSDEMGSTVAAHEGEGQVQPFAASAAPPGVQGLDVSGHQGNVDWASVAALGGRFAYVKATESTTYQNPYFGQQYNGSAAAGLIRGAYHFALPDRSSGAAQADFFVDHGGGWSADGRTLPPLLDLEYNPYGPNCYGLTPTAMVAWVRDFSREVRARTSRNPVLFTTTGWWNGCTGGDLTRGKVNPLIISRWNSSPYPLPAGWKTYKFWQHNSKGKFPGDQEVFHGTMTALHRFAVGG